MSKLEEALWQAFDGSLMVGDIVKHADHDQTTHGNWARQEQLPGIDWDGFKISDMERLKRSIGLRPGQEIWQHPAMAGAYWPRGDVPDDEWEAEYAVIEHVEGEWAKFGPCRQIRDAAEKLLGLGEPEQGDPTLDPYQESGLDPNWGGGEARVSDEEAVVMALWLLEQSDQVEGKFYRGTEASVERMGLSEGDEFDVGLLSFAGYPQTAASFGAETIFVVENPIGYQSQQLDMAVRYTDWDVNEFYNVVRTHAEKAELEDMYGEDIFVVGDLVSEEAHPELFYDAFDYGKDNLDKEFLLTGSYRIASIEQFNRGAQEEFYVTDKGEVPEVVSVVTLEPIDRDGDGIILEGTDEERFVGKAEKSRRPAWLRLFELSLGEMALASSAVKKHADHDQSSHGNWATKNRTRPIPKWSSELPASIGRDSFEIGGSALPVVRRGKEDTRLLMADFFERVGREEDAKRVRADIWEWPAVQAEMARYTQETIQDATFAMRIPPRALADVIDGTNGPAGQFLNQHQVGESRGYFDPTSRVAVEGRQGVPVDAPPYVRPKYGYLEGTEWRDDDAAFTHYGSVRLRFKEQVAERATLTFGDTLNGGLPAVRFLDVLDGTVSAERLVASTSANGSSATAMYLKDAGYKRDYAEVQYHGRLGLQDVDEVIFTGNTRQSYGDDSAKANQVVQALRDRGITVKYAPRFARFGQTEVEERVIIGAQEPIDADGDGWIYEGTDKERRA